MKAAVGNADGGFVKKYLYFSVIFFDLLAALNCHIYRDID